MANNQGPENQNPGAQQMEEGPMIDAMRGPIVEQLKILTHEFSSQGAFNHIQPFDGSDPKAFRPWVKEINKYCAIVSADEDRKKRVTFGTSRGVVSSFIERFLRDNQNVTYRDLVAELTSRFSDVADSHSALQILRKIKQNRSETIQAFHERIMDVAEQAFINVNLADFAYQEQLVVCFTDGLCDNRIARHIIRQRPTNLEDALKAAMTERNMLRQLDIRGKNDRESSSAPSDRREEPMDIGAVNVVCFRCQKPGHLKKDCRVVFPKSFPTQSRNMFDGHCFSCGRYGHKAVSCYSPNVSKNSQGYNRSYQRINMQPRIGQQNFNRSYTQRDARMQSGYRYNQNTRQSSYPRSEN